MPKYTVQDTATGKKVTFEWNDPKPPTDADLEQVFAEAHKSAPATSTTSGLTPMSFVRPALEIGGMTAGGLLGAPAGPMGTVGGAGLGYGAGKGIADLIEGKPSQQTVGGALLSGAKDVATGATMEMGGQVAGKVIGGAISGIGKLGKQAIGKVTGAGPGAAEEAVKGSKAFTDAMRGKVKGEDIVDSAKEALGTIKANRAAAYQEKLAEIGKIKGELDTAPIGEKAISLAQRYGVKLKDVSKKPFQPQYEWDMSRTALGSKGNKDVGEILDIVKNWGSQPGDKTPVGLDTLKRQLDDFYSESSNARAFVAELRNEVKNLIVKNVPEYAEMTKGYAETTKIIKDIESGLMLRKQGMTGRVVADQTLRRLMSSMRDNFELRRELVGILESQGGGDISGQIAGYTMNPLLPRGLQGVGASMAGTAAALNYLNPSWVPLIAASSPRVSGEFLKMVGMASRAVPGASTAVGKAAAYLTVPPADNRKSYQDLLGPTQ